MNGERSNWQLFSSNPQISKGGIECSCDAKLCMFESTYGAPKKILFINGSCSTYFSADGPMPRFLYLMLPTIWIAKEVAISNIFGGAGKIMERFPVGIWDWKESGQTWELGNSMIRKKRKASIFNVIHHFICNENLNFLWNSKHSDFAIKPIWSLWSCIWLLVILSVVDWFGGSGCSSELLESNAID
jgi:hypothetical protein